ncbi:hypothetical protein [Butyricimonas virosa]|uniref:hypothetical protein n=1 Tax=Butyricimonas virosa TaxID=544645 RepID=UPI003AAB3C38
MPDAKDVKPGKWSNIIILYDNGDYSVCWGNYDGGVERTMGIRWNDNYPRQGAWATWFVENHLFIESKIIQIIKLLHMGDCPGDKDLYLSNCEMALKEFLK